MSQESGTSRRRVLGLVGVAAVAVGGYVAYKWWRRSARSQQARETLSAEAVELKNTGNEAFKHKRFAEAVKHYTRALELQPQGHVLYSNRSIAYIKLGRYEEALRDARKCIELMPSFARGYERKARALHGLGRTAEGLEACEAGLKNAQPADVKPIFNVQTDLMNSTVNRAFVFIKPHAVTDTVKALVKDTLAFKGCKIVSEGELGAQEIDDKKLIDQHYYAIASKATILKPHELPVPEDKFADKFGLGWQEALLSGRVFNAMDGCSELGVDSDQMNALWAKCKGAGEMIKFGGGFYCGRIAVEGHEAAFVFNGFFMSMRSKYTRAGAKIHYYEVEWQTPVLSWEDFRAQVLGTTDPAEAPATSLRGMILAEWEKLGLSSKPDTGDNGVHASASPFEALVERANWLGRRLEEDPFGKMLLGAGLSADTMREWGRDPQVEVPGQGRGSVFDALEDMDTDACVRMCKAIRSQSQS